MKRIRLTPMILGAGLVLGLSVLSISGDSKDGFSGDSNPAARSATDDYVTHPVSGEEIEVGPVMRRSVKEFLAQPEATPILKPAQLDSAIQTSMLQYHIRGVSACAIVGDAVVWEGNYGYADSAGRKPMTGSTLIELASISKTFVANAVMQLVENGLVDLDANVNGYLPFPVRNCYHPEAIITPRMLLAHVSSIDRNEYGWIYDVCNGTDCSTPLTTYLESYLVPGGSKYQCTNYLNALPGDTGVYCNWAFAVLGALVEQVTGQTFEQYCQDSLFLPLGMTNSSWFLANLDTADIAMPLWWSAAAGRYRSYGHYGIPIYPCAQLRTSSRQLARHLSAFLGFGEIDGVRILDSLTVEEMRVTQYPDHQPSPGAFYGLAWYQQPAWGGGWVWGHGGSLSGIATIMLGSAAERSGYIMLSNTSWNGGHNNIVPLIEVFSRDTDLDGKIAGLDNCPEAHNPGQEDVDHDGYGDICEPDVDHDGVLTGADNCPNVYNPGQEDANHDSIGDACCCVVASGNVDCDPSDGVDISDLSALIDNLYITFTPLCCPKEANVDGQPGTDISDLSALIDFLYISFTPTASCQ